MTLQYEGQTVSQMLPVILSDLLDYGEEAGSRNGRVKELLNPQIVINDPVRREVLSIGRGANVFAQIAETMWVLAGRNDIDWLSAYLPRARDYSDDGSTWRAGYGPRIRFKHGDQFAQVLDLLAHDPMSRQAVIQIWDAEEDTTTDRVKDRACNTQLQFQSRLGELHLTVTVRSNDVFWGWSGINAFEWSVLQEIAASLLGIKVGKLVFNTGNLHLYAPHWKRAREVKYEELEYRHIPFNPNRVFTDLEQVDLLIDRWFVWESLCREGKAPIEQLDEWEEPLFQSWAAAIAWYWQRQPEWLETLQGTALAVAIARTPSSVLPEPSQMPQTLPVGVGHPSGLAGSTAAFYAFVTSMHATKHESYGDSWKKRGEKLSILANIARKVDRLGVGDQYDSSADTVIDLWVYLAKYICWLNEQEAEPANVNRLLEWSLYETEPWSMNIDSIRAELDAYMDQVDVLDTDVKRAFLRTMLKQVAPIARNLWAAENEYRGADVD